MTAIAAFHVPKIKTEEADRPMAVALHTSRLKGERILTHRCVGCGDKTDTRLRPLILTQGGLWPSLVRVGALFLGVLGTLNLSSFVIGALRLRPGASALAIFVATVVLMGWTARVVTRKLVPHVRTAFARCQPCHRRQLTGRAWMALIILVGSLTPVFAVILERNAHPLGRGSAGIVLAALSGVLMVLWLSPIFRAGQRRRVLVKRVTAEQVLLQVPPTFHNVIRLERPDLLQSARVA